MSLRRVAPHQIRSSMAVGPGSGMIPKGVGAPPPPGMDNRRGKLMCIKVRMLDDSVGVFHLGHKALGQALFDEVCRHLNLLECDYFSLEFTDCYGNRCWLDKDKPILRQITTTHSDARFYFIVKFYTPNPSDLVEEYTRYLFALQIKRDLAMGELLCNENTAALLASYIVQSDCGDFAAEDYPDDSYLSSARFIPNQSSDFQRKVMENHKKLIGMSPGESDLILLETARRCDYYGVKLHAAKDVEGTEVSLTIAHMGIRVFHQFQCVSTFSWAKIRKLSFKRRKLLIKLHPESHQYYKETIEFLFESRNECKNFWKKCVEHHTFFRCIEVLPMKKAREGRLFSKGSAFRYQGRTQKQLIDYIREHRKRREPFTRPIKSGLSSSSNGRLSRPAFFDTNHPAYATVSERSVNLIGSGTLPSRNVPVYNMNGERSMSRDQHISSQSHFQGINQQIMTKGTKSYFPGEISLNRYGTTASIRNHRHRNSQNYPSNSSAAAVNGERMCLSDMESNDVCSLAGGGTMNSRYRQQQSDFRSLKPSTVKSVKAGAIAAPSNSGNITDTSDNDAITSVSLPNVLGDDVQIVCREFELKCECPPKSASGDNFLELHQPPRDYDNISEGSYKLSDNELRVAHSDIQPVPMNPVYATTFTAKRVGNVIVKKVVSNTRSTPNTTDDEDPYSERRFDSGRKKIETGHNQQMTSGYVHRQEPSKSNQVEIGDANSQRRFYVEKKHPSSAPASYAEYPLHQKLVPIEIDGPNVNLDEHRKLSNKKEMSKISKIRSTAPPQTPIRASVTKIESDRWPMMITESQPSVSHTEEVQPKYPKIVYTSKGTILHRPKIIPDEDDLSASENIYSNVSFTHASDTGQSYMTIAQPQQIPKTYGAIRPLPGKVITKENLVITPEGYRERRPKPVVPPKPKNLVGSSETGFVESTSVCVVPESKPNHPVVNLQKEETFQSCTTPSSMRELNRPALISVQSEDHPEIQKCHLFNSDIPYVLTMRNISTEAESCFSTFKDTSSKNTVSEAVVSAVDSGSLHRSLSSSRSPDSLRRRKSLDLVPKKRLPSPGNFSSQDHSLSPSTPESGDVLEYLLRRRSIEKSAIAKRGRRGDPRRQTQPVRFNIPSNPEIEGQQIGAISQPNLNDNVEEAIYVIERNKSHEKLMKELKENDRVCTHLNIDSDFKTETEQSSESQKEKEEHSRSNEVATDGNKLMDSTNVDDFPPPPPPPPLPPSLPLPTVLKQSVDSVAPQPITEACMQESVETLPYADESVSSRASCASKDETIDKISSVPSSTLRTPTGVLWTDF
ncbi:FERM, ARHGEF and pleckstrin domain-containing protein [Dirofilaria immitis]